MPFEPPQPSADRHAVIPPHIQEAMIQHLQQSMPPHLKQYTQGNHSYIPQHAQEAILEHMQKSMPGHMKPYAGAYMKQQLGQRSGIALGGTPPQDGPAGLAQAGPGPHMAPQQHFQPISPAPAAEQPAEAATLPEPEQTYPPGQTPAPAEQPSTYDFITNPATPAVPARQLPGGNSPLMRAAIVVAGVFVLIIIFSVVKGLISGGSGAASYVVIAQDQQEIIHLATEAGQQQGTSVSTQNFAATAQLSVTSSQATLLNYLASSKQKLSPKVLDLKVSQTLDTQLTNAAAATTYDQTFQTIMQAQLNGYVNDLKKTYQQAKTRDGRNLLNDNYQQAELLLTQLNGPAQ